MSRLHVVILAGGSGTRFWPLSRQSRPKQFLTLTGERSLLQATVDRVLPLQPASILVVTNARQVAESEQQLAGITDLPLRVVAEPVARNTAPAVGLAARLVAASDPDGVMLVLPADHFITDAAGFRQVLARAAAAAAADEVLVTLGITPTHPETGYGYLHAAAGSDGVLPVQRFVEKPDRERALAYLASGDYYWNSGMFVWRAGVILRAIERHLPELANGLAALEVSADWQPAALAPLLAELYPALPDISIDYGVMERASRVVMLPAAFGWSDVGSWSALPELLPAGADGSCALDVAELVSVAASDNLVVGNGKVVALVGVSGLVVVDTADALLVCRRDDAQQVRQVVAELARRGREACL